MLTSIKNHVKPGYIVLLIFLAFSMSFPIVSDNRFYIRLITEIFFFAAMGNAWNIIGGYGKQISWASAAFVAVGAYAGILPFVRLTEPFATWFAAPVSPWLSAPVGMVLAVLLAVIIGKPCFRMRGVYFAIATIACTTIVRLLLLYFRYFTGGAVGVQFRIVAEDSWWLLQFRSPGIPFYFIAFFWMLVTAGIVMWVERNKLGYYLRAICEDQDAAESLGIKSSTVKLNAFMLSAAMLSLTGTLFVFFMRYADPGMFASHALSVRIAIVVILGGMGRVWGPLVGAFLSLTLLQVSNQYLRDFGGAATGWVLYGLLIVLMVLFRPNGIISLFDNFGANMVKLRDKLFGRAQAQSGGDGK